MLEKQKQNLWQKQVKVDLLLLDLMQSRYIKKCPEGFRKAISEARLYILRTWRDCDDTF